MKVCTQCGIEKPFSEFYKKTKTSYRGNCKACCNKTSKEWVKNNPDRRKQIREKWDASNKEYKSNAAREYRAANLPRALWRAAKNRSQKFGLEFDLTPEDIIVPEYCPVFGYKLEVNAGAGPNSPSLDKINPELGYIKGNIQVISHLANTMKNNATNEQLVLFAKWILNESKTCGNS